jgi:hypothetical protein
VSRRITGTYSSSEMLDYGLKCADAQRSADEVSLPAAAQTAEDASLRVDAERYRWLRDGYVGPNISIMIYQFPDEHQFLLGDKADAAIDSARKSM